MQRFAVIGLGRFGQQLARSLSSDGSDVIAIDASAKSVDQVCDEVALAVCLDATDEEALKAQGVADVDAAIVGIGEDFEATILTVAALRSLDVTPIYARAETDIQARILTRVGATGTVNPERESALRWAHRLSLPDLQQYVDLGESHAMIYTAAPGSFHNKTLAELALREKYGVNLVAIERRVTIKTKSEGSSTTKPVISVPTAATAILPDDVLILVGSNESLASFGKS